MGDASQDQHTAPGSGAPASDGARAKGADSAQRVDAAAAVTSRLGIARWQMISVAVALVVAMGGLCLMGVSAIAGPGNGASPTPAGEDTPASPSTGEDDFDSNRAPGGGGTGSLAPNALGPDAEPRDPESPGDFPWPGDQAPPGDDQPADGTPNQTTSDNAIDGWLDTWSPAIFRLGFSFFVGFAVAYAVRGIIKLVVIFAGLLFLTLFALQYADLVVVNWELMEQRYDELSAWIGREFSGVMSLARGYVPSAASGAGGMVIGFRRR